MTGEKQTGSNNKPSWYTDDHGVPLPIVQKLPRGVKKYDAKKNLHHSYHYCNNEALQTEAGKALRASRLELTYRVLHVRGHQLFDMPNLNRIMSPHTSADCIRELVMNNSAYVPMQGIDFSSGEPVVVELSGRQRNKISRNIKTEKWDPDALTRKDKGSLNRYRPMADFMIGYAIDNFTDEEDVDDLYFLNNKKSRRARKARAITRRIISELGSTVQPTYWRARRRSQIPGDKPRQASDIIQNTLIKTYPGYRNSVPDNYKSNTYNPSQNALAIDGLASVIAERVLRVA